MIHAALELRLRPLAGGAGFVGGPLHTQARATPGPRSASDGGACGDSATLLCVRRAAAFWKCSAEMTGSAIRCHASCASWAAETTAQNAYATSLYHRQQRYMKQGQEAVTRTRD